PDPCTAAIRWRPIRPRLLQTQRRRRGRHIDRACARRVRRGEARSAGVRRAVSSGMRELHTDVLHGDEHLVALAADHPGFNDREYRKRRDTIARASVAWRRGDPVPDVPYSDDEHAVWRSILEALEPVHALRAGRT